MSIMEKNLPIAESLGEGDMVRIVTGGNSKQIDANKVGGPLIVTYTESSDPEDSDGWECDHTMDEIADAIRSGMRVVARYEEYILSLIAYYDTESSFEVAFSMVTFDLGSPNIDYSYAKITHMYEDGEDSINIVRGSGQFQ